MANPRKVDVATEADWSFYEDRRAVTAIERAARKAAREFEHVELVDAIQDACLWLGVRPAFFKKAVETDDWAQLQQDIYTNALRKPAVAESNRRARTMSKEQRDEEQGWES